MLPAMHSSFDLPAYMTVPRPSGWVQSGERWDLWWNGRSVANIVPHAVLGFRVYLDARKMSQTKVVAATNVRQARRYAERWCAARLCPQLRLREAVARLVDVAPEASAAPSPALSAEQRQQARRLAEAGAGEVARIKQALAPRLPATEARPELQARGGTWSIPGQAPSSRHSNGNASSAGVMPRVPRARSSPLR
ncbi:Phage protein [Stenotrophomonas maltophilia]|nr:Phage protein [Stenotrophomonas maltophilia]